MVAMAELAGLDYAHLLTRLRKGTELHMQLPSSFVVRSLETLVVNNIRARRSRTCQGHDEQEDFHTELCLSPILWGRGLRKVTGNRELEFG
jgi:hypothetical protein